jgi:hypothetical protein
VVACDVVFDLLYDSVGAKQLRGKLRRAEAVGMFFRIPED